MKKKYHIPSVVFTLILLWGFVVCAKQFTVLLPLYEDAHLRSQVQSVVQHFADEKGLLLSSIRIEGIEKDSVHVLVREYRKGRDTKTPYTVPLFLP